VDFTKIDYPAGTGQGPSDVPAGGWENVDYSGVDFSKVNYNQASDTPAPKPAFFSSTYVVNATPDQVVNGTNPTGGLQGASGSYWIGIRSDANVICYDITLDGFRGDYQSPAVTATHIHEAARGASGPPRVAFPNPTGEGTRKSVGCLTGPFKTGVMANGKDSGEGFHVSQIEKNPAGFFADVHSSLAVPGAVRGQLA